MRSRQCGSQAMPQTEKILFRVFVYGTLKQGQRNFARYCRGVLNVEPAQVVGRLFDLPYGYPMLDVPLEHILAVGTEDYCRDAALLKNLAPKQPPQLPPPGDWDSIAGEILTFEDPAERLPRLDMLENFRPGQAESLYRRVVVRALAPHNELVWTYIAPDGRLPTGAVRIGPCWPWKNE